MFALKITRQFTFEIAHGGIYIKLYSREMYYSRAAGFAFDSNGD